MTLAAALEQPQNNILLLRITAATLVVFSHSHTIARGPGTVEPPAPAIPTSFGTIGVSNFFLLSGLLIARSYARRERFVPFVRARALRIYPALIVAVLFCAAVVGPMFSSLPFWSYATHPATWSYVTRNATLTGLAIQSTLPSTFEANPLPFAVNDPLWTLPYEMCMYASVAALGVLRVFRSRVVFTAIAASLAAWMVVVSYGTIPPATETLLFVRLGMFFLAGVFCYVYRDRIPLDGRVLLAGGIVAAALYRTPWFMAAFRLVLGYAVLAVAFLPRGRILAVNRLPDCSYGLYIYAFPCQQALAALLPGIAPWPLFAAAMLLATPIAVLSWIFVERPALALKDPRRRRIPLLRPSVVPDVAGR